MTEGHWETDPSLTRLVAPVGPRLLKVPGEALLLVFWDLSEHRVGDVKDSRILEIDTYQYTSHGR